MKKALLVVSFGTTHLDTLEKNISVVEKTLAAAYPDLPFFRAFTSKTVRSRLKSKFGMEVDSVAEALQTLKRDGFEKVLLQPTLLLPGEEYDALCADAKANSEGMELVIGKPLLWDESDMEIVAEALKHAYPVDEDTVLLAMGHGTAHIADGVYTRMREKMKKQDMDLCTVEGSIDFDAAVASLIAGTKRSVHLVPLLLVAGDHSKNDMAGEEPDSLRSRLEQAGFTVSWSLKGLGELPEIREAYCRKALELK